MVDVISHNSRTNRHRIFELGGRVDQVTCHVRQLFKVKRSKVKVTRSRTGLSVEESIRMTEDKDKWRKYVCGVANPRIEDGRKRQNRKGVWGSQNVIIFDTLLTGHISSKNAITRQWIIINFKFGGNYHCGDHCLWYAL